MIDALDLADAPRASGQWGMIRIPAPLVRRDLRNLAIDDVRIDDAAAAAIVTAGARDDGFARFRRETRRFLDCLHGHSEPDPHLHSQVVLA